MKFVITLIYFLFCLKLSAQNFNPKTIPITENPTIEEFSFLKEEIKGRQVVMLGEISHFDGNVFEMKTKLVEYLVEEMGFTTIAFESGIYDVWQAQKEINQGENVKEAFRNSLFSIWAKRVEFQSFIRFFEANKGKLKLFGFDYQITGKFGVENLVNDLYNYSKANNYKLKLNQDDLTLLLESITKSGMFDEEDISRKEYNEALSKILIQISKQSESEEKFYWTQIIKSLIALADDKNENEEVLSTFNTNITDNIRDKQMANNLLAYIKLHPNEKIICWGANQHFSNDMSSITTPILKDFIPMGSYVKKELKNNVYSLAAVTAEDSIYLQNRWHKTPIEPTSFESFLKNKKVVHLFISSNQPEMKKPQLNRLFSPITFVESNLSELHDGYFYFNKTLLATIVDDDLEVETIRERINESFLKEIKENTTETVEYSITNLDEVILYGKKSPYQIIKKVIKNLKLNYPNDPFNSVLYTNVVSKINDSTILDFDFIISQYDFGYVTHVNRSAKTLQQIRWNTKTVFTPQSLREYHGLVYNSPIQSATFLRKRKFKKFNFELEETKSINGEDVYIIRFSSTRNHSTYTRRVYLSNYSGYIYVNKKDHAVIKIFENWKVIEFPESFKEGYNFTDSYEKYIKKEYYNESTLTEFKKVNGLYYISHATNTITGQILDIQDDSLPFEIKIDSYWSEFNIENPIKISFKKEEHLFEKVKFNETFWNQFKKPN